MFALVPGCSALGWSKDTSQQRRPRGQDQVGQQQDLCCNSSPATDWLRQCQGGHFTLPGSSTLVHGV